MLRTRIVLGAFAGLAIVVAVLVAGRIYEQGQQAVRAEAFAMDAQSVLWRKIVDSQAEAIATGVSGLARNRGAMTALSKNDAPALSKAIVGLTNRMLTRNVITRLHITGNDASILHSSVEGASGVSTIAQQAIERGEVVSGLTRDIDGTLQTAVAS